MGYYEGQWDRPCPRCGGVVATVFFSIGPMSLVQRCEGCGTEEFTKDEQARLGNNVPRARLEATDPVEEAFAVDPR